MFTDDALLKESSKEKNHQEFGFLYINYLIQFNYYINFCQLKLLSSIVYVYLLK